MKSTCLLYIVCQVLKLLLIIIYKIQPSKFAYFLPILHFTFWWIPSRWFGSNLHNHYSLHLQNWTALKYILKEVWGYLSFVLEQPNPASHKHMSNYLNLSWWAFQAPLFRNFPWLWLLILLLVFMSLSGHQCKASVTLVLIVPPQEESRNSVLIYI